MMSLHRTQRQSQSPQVRGRVSLVALGAIAVLALGAGAFIFLLEGPSPPPSALTPGVPAAPAAAAPSVSVPAVIETPASVSPPAAPEPPADAPPTEPEPMIAALENRFRAATTQKRIELSQEIAARNDAEAVQAIGRLFRIERHPGVKVALLAGLADINQSEGPTVRFQIVNEALHGEARDVRLTALDLLDRFDDERATAVLRETMQRDPDVAVRRLASALYRARLEDTQP